MTDTPLQICLDAANAERSFLGAWRELDGRWRLALVGFMLADFLAYSVRLVGIALVGAFFGLLLLAAFAGCAPRATVKPESATPLCALAPPPPVTGYPSTCSPRVCLTDDDARALVLEIQALSTWARDAYAECPHVAASEGKGPTAALAPGEGAR